MNFALLISNLPDIYPQHALHVQAALAKPSLAASAFKWVIARVLSWRD
jgi:hypothetical protein